MTRDSDARARAVHSRDMRAVRDILRALRGVEADLAEDIRRLLALMRGARPGSYAGPEAKALVRTASRMLPMAQAVRASAELDGPVTNRRLIRLLSRAYVPEMERAYRDGLRPYTRRAAEETVARESYELAKRVGVAVEVPVPDWTDGQGDDIARRTSPAKALGEEVADMAEGMAAEGRTPDEVADAVAKGTGTEAWRTRRTVRTAVTEAGTEASHVFMASVGIERYRVVCTLDEVTCPTCGAMDGREFDVSETRIGRTAPDFHPNCRCTTVAVIDRETMAELRASGLARAARDSRGGHVEVDPEMTYGEYRERYL